MGVDVRMTREVARVLHRFLEEPGTPRYGFALMELTGLSSGTLYPILARLERVGWLVRETEAIDASEGGRLPRKLYRLTPGGASAARHDLVTFTKEPTPSEGSSPSWGW